MKLTAQKAHKIGLHAVTLDEAWQYGIGDDSDATPDRRYIGQVVQYSVDDAPLSLVVATGTDENGAPCYWLDPLNAASVDHLMELVLRIARGEEQDAQGKCRRWLLTNYVPADTEIDAAALTRWFPGEELNREGAVTLLVADLSDNAPATDESATERD